MFEILKDELLQLNDSQLRELVARLCEAELRQKGFPASAVRWGGAQTAPDGGLDVDCRVEAGGFTGDFVPRGRTGFQVKKHAMPAARIKDEMSPKGALRPIFPALASENGCYAIVSLADDITPEGPMLLRRLSVMEAQIEAIEDQSSIELRFYGRGDLANWLRQHPGVQLWVREVLGLPLNEWRPYGRWTRTPSGVNDDLICEKGILIRPPGTDDEGLAIAPGIEAIRQLVRSHEKAVRIIGLSGVGKTRIVQALFEEGVGTGALSKHLAIYADLGASPQPSARDVIDRLAAEQRDAVIVLDNCPSPMHQELAPLVADMQTIQLISIEYDIRDDKPESTSVVHIDADGLDVAEALVLRRCPALGQVNARRIAKFSGGNARLALVLADAVKEEGSLSEFSNEQLFERMFYQRNSPAGDLLEAAEILALVYSFSVDGDEQGGDELGTLAKILGADRKRLFRATQTLVERQLAQKRGRWLAVLPHAVANRLAARALRNVDTKEILKAFQDLPTLRLLTSFGKRLGYLHDHEVAQKIVDSWLAPNGILHDICGLTGDGIHMLKNVAPVAPEKVLRALENQARGKSAQEFLSDIIPHDLELVGLLVSIAYDPDLFERCINLLVKLAVGDDQRGIQIRSQVAALFSLHLSGTEASPDIRERVMRGFLRSTNREKRRLGLEMLKSALRSQGWSSIGAFEFGARTRSWGYHPQTVAERDRWFLRFIVLFDEMDVQGNPELSEKLRDFLAAALPGLWSYPGIRSELAAIMRDLHARHPWIEGWRAVRRTKLTCFPRGENNSQTSPALKAINELERDFRPKELVDQVRAHVLSVGAAIFSWDGEDFKKTAGGEQKSYGKVAQKAHSLGETVAADPKTLAELSQELFTCQATYAFEFGRGLAEQTPDLGALLVRLVEWLERAGDEARQCDVLKAALRTLHERNEQAAAKFIDEVIERPALRRFTFDLHVSTPFSAADFERLLRVLEIADVPTREFAALGWWIHYDDLTEKNAEQLMRKLLERADGAQVVLESMSMRLMRMKEGKITFGKELERVSLVAAAQLLRGRDYFSHDVMTDHYLSEVLRHCLDEDEYSEEVDGIFEALSLGLKESYGCAGSLHVTFEAIAETATGRFLDFVFFDSALEDHEREAVFSEQQERNLLSSVDVSKLLHWCEHGDFNHRLVLLAKAIYPFEKVSEKGEVVLTAQARSIVDAATNPSEIMEALASSVHPSSWNGYLSNTIEKRRKALEALLEHDRADICNAARTLIENTRTWEEEERQRERAEDERRGQRFE